MFLSLTPDSLPREERRIRPRRAEQVPSALADGCDPAAGCSAAIPRVLMCAFTVASPKSGPLLHVPAHPRPPGGRGGGKGGAASGILTMLSRSGVRCWKPSAAEYRAV